MKLQVTIRQRYRRSLKRGSPFQLRRLMRRHGLKRGPASRRARTRLFMRQGLPGFPGTLVSTLPREPRTRLLRLAWPVV